MLSPGCNADGNLQAVAKAQLLFAAELGDIALRFAVRARRVDVVELQLAAQGATRDSQLQGGDSLMAARFGERIDNGLPLQTAEVVRAGLA